MPINHTVQEGDSIPSIADLYGFFVDTIWNYPANAALRQKRKSMDILMPGDVVVVPDKTAKKEQRSTDQRHVFKLKGVPAVFRLQVFDGEIPRANQHYTLTIDGRIYDGTTDSEGVLEATIPPSAKKGDLLIGPDQFRLRILLGTLDPSNEVAGVQKRLNNLGFNCGEPDGDLSDETKDALRRFQRRFDLPVSGEIDDATRHQLESLNDSLKDFPPEPQRLPAEERNSNA